MKKTKVKVSGRQLEGMARNYGSMSLKNQRRYAPVIIMMAAIVRTIKGKLDMNLLTRDGTFLVRSQAIFNSLTANTGSFYTPAFVNLATMSTQISDFISAIDDVQQGVMGAEGAKMAAKNALKITLNAALGYVNNIAFLDQVNAVEIITGANFEVIPAPSVHKQDFAVKQGTATGEVMLRSLAVKFANKYVKATYEWQKSTDNGTTWIWLDPTTKAKTTATGLTPGVNVQFRKRTSSSKTGTSAWCTPIAIIPA